MFDHLRNTMKAHAMDMYPQAACGVVLGDEDHPTYHPLDDVADGSRESFHVEAQALHPLQGAHGPLRGIVHSHPSAEREKAEGLLFTPSATEMRLQAGLAVPFGVLVCDGKRSYNPFWFGDQCPIQPMLGRPFLHGVWDCYSLIRDWFRLNRTILLPDFPRDWNWWIGGMDLYRTGFEQAGFRPVDPGEVREGDGVLFQLRSKVPNHAAVLLGDGWMLHHPAAFSPYDILRLSNRVEIARWTRHATHWLRHESEL